MEIPRSRRTRGMATALALTSSCRPPRLFSPHSNPHRASRFSHLSLKIIVFYYFPRPVQRAHFTASGPRAFLTGVLRSPEIARDAFGAGDGGVEGRGGGVVDGGDVGVLREGGGRGRKRKVEVVDVGAKDAEAGGADEVGEGVAAVGGGRNEGVVGRRLFGVGGVSWFGGAFWKGGAGKGRVYL